MKTIFIVDDEKMITDMYTAFLSPTYNIIVENNALLALETFQLNPDKFDLIVTDQTMPNMSGGALINYIHDIRSDIPIILCSGIYLNDSTSIPGVDISKVHTILGKPISMKILCEVIDNIFNKD